MNAHDVAAILELLQELRDMYEYDKFDKDRTTRITKKQKTETLWNDILNLLGEARQRDIARFDGWLQRVEDALDTGGDVAKLITLGMRLTEQRAQLLKLDARAAIPLVPQTLIAAQ